MDDVLSAIKARLDEVMSNKQLAGDYWFGYCEALRDLLAKFDDASDDKQSDLISNEPLTPDEIAYAVQLAQDEDGA